VQKLSRADKSLSQKKRRYLPNPRVLGLIGFGILVLLSVANPIAAQIGNRGVGNRWNPEVRGTLSSEWAGFVADGSTQKWDTVLDPELSLDLGEWGRFTSIARLRIDPVEKLEPGDSAKNSSSRGYGNRRQFVGDTTDLELREFYIDVDIGDIYLRAGKQQIVWGEADGLRVLDLINPQSFREFIVSDVESRRIPTWSLNLEIPMSTITTQIVWIPDHTYDESVSANSQFAFVSPQYSLVLPEGAVASGAVVIEPVNKPDQLLSDDDFGLRLSGFNKGWDWSVNYLYHYFDQPVIYRRIDTNNVLRLSPEYERTHVLGFSGSKPFGKVTVRGETAFSSNRFFNTTEPEDNDGVFSTGELGYVVGLDYLPDGETVVSTQVFQVVLLNPVPGAARETVDTTFSLRVSREFMNDTIVAEAQVIASAQGEDGVLNLDLSYQLRSELELTFGVDTFFGKKEGLFGQFEKSNRVSAAVKYSF